MFCKSRLSLFSKIIALVLACCTGIPPFPIEKAQFQQKLAPLSALPRFTPVSEAVLKDFAAKLTLFQTQPTTEHLSALEEILKNHQPFVFETASGFTRSFSSSSKSHMIVGWNGKYRLADPSAKGLLAATLEKSNGWAWFNFFLVKDTTVTLTRDLDENNKKGMTIELKGMESGNVTRIAGRERRAVFNSIEERDRHIETEKRFLQGYKLLKEKGDGSVLNQLMEEYRSLGEEGFPLIFNSGGSLHFVHLENQKFKKGKFDYDLPINTLKDGEGELLGGLKVRVVYEEKKESGLSGVSRISFVLEDSEVPVTKGVRENEFGDIVPSQTVGNGDLIDSLDFVLYRDEEEKENSELIEDTFRDLVPKLVQPEGYRAAMKFMNEDVAPFGRPLIITLFGKLGLFRGAKKSKKGNDRENYAYIVLNKSRKPDRDGEDPFFLRVKVDFEAITGQAGDASTETGDEEEGEQGLIVKFIALHRVELTDGKTYEAGDSIEEIKIYKYKDKKEERAAENQINQFLSIGKARFYSFVLRHFLYLLRTNQKEEAENLLKQIKIWFDEYELNSRGYSFVFALHSLISHTLTSDSSLIKNPSLIWQININDPKSHGLQLISSYKTHNASIPVRHVETNPFQPVLSTSQVGARQSPADISEKDCSQELLKMRGDEGQTEGYHIVSCPSFDQFGYKKAEITRTERDGEEIVKKSKFSPVVMALWNMTRLLNKEEGSLLVLGTLDEFSSENAEAMKHYFGLEVVQPIRRNMIFSSRNVESVFDLSRHQVGTLYRRVRNLSGLILKQTAADITETEGYKAFIAGKNRLMKNPEKAIQRYLESIPEKEALRFLPVRPRNGTREVQPERVVRRAFLTAFESIQENARSDSRFEGNLQSLPLPRLTAHVKVLWNEELRSEETIRSGHYQGKRPGQEDRKGKIRDGSKKKKGKKKTSGKKKKPDDSKGKVKNPKGEDDQEEPGKEAGQEETAAEEALKAKLVDVFNFATKTSAPKTHEQVINEIKQIIAALQAMEKYYHEHSSENAGFEDKLKKTVHQLTYYRGLLDFLIKEKTSFTTPQDFLLGLAGSPYEGEHIIEAKKYPDKVSHLPVLKGEMHDIAIKLYRAILDYERYMLLVHADYGKEKVEMISEMVLRGVKEGSKILIVGRSDQRITELLAAVRSKSPEEEPAGVYQLINGSHTEAAKEAIENNGIILLPSDTDFVPKSQNNSVIGCHISRLHKKAMKNTFFDIVFVEDAKLLSQAELIQAAGKGASMVIFSDAFNVTGLRPLKKNLRRIGLAPEQQRLLTENQIEEVTESIDSVMIGNITRFPKWLVKWTKTFYLDSLQSMQEPRQNGHAPVRLIETAFEEEAANPAGMESGPNTGFINREEIQRVKEIVAEWKSRGIPESEISVITPYEAQAKAVRSALKLQEIKVKTAEPFIRGEEIIVSSTDEYPHHQDPYVIISFVRSNRDFDIGKWNNLSRLISALTRAKVTAEKGELVLLMNSETFTQSDLEFEGVSDNPHILYKTGETFTDLLKAVELSHASVEMAVKKREEEAVDQLIEEFDRQVSRWQEYIINEDRNSGEMVETVKVILKKLLEKRTLSGKAREKIDQVLFDKYTAVNAVYTLTYQAEKDAGDLQLLENILKEMWEKQGWNDNPLFKEYTRPLEKMLAALSGGEEDKLPLILFESCSSFLKTRTKDDNKKMRIFIINNIIPLFYKDKFEPFMDKVRNILAYENSYKGRKSEETNEIDSRFIHHVETVFVLVRRKGFFDQATPAIASLVTDTQDGQYEEVRLWRSKKAWPYFVIHDAEKTVLRIKELLNQEEIDHDALINAILDAKRIKNYFDLEELLDIFYTSLQDHIGTIRAILRTMDDDAQRRDLISVLTNYFGISKHYLDIRIINQDSEYSDDLPENAGDKQQNEIDEWLNSDEYQRYKGALREITAPIENALEILEAGYGDTAINEVIKYSGEYVAVVENLADKNQAEVTYQKYIVEEIIPRLYGPKYEKHITALREYIAYVPVTSENIAGIGNLFKMLNDIRGGTGLYDPLQPVFSRPDAESSKIELEQDSWYAGNWHQYVQYMFEQDAEALFSAKNPEALTEKLAVLEKYTLYEPFIKGKLKKWINKNIGFIRKSLHTAGDGVDLEKVMSLLGILYGEDISHFFDDEVIQEFKASVEQAEELIAGGKHLDADLAGTLKNQLRSLVDLHEKNKSFKEETASLLNGHLSLISRLFTYHYEEDDDHIRNKIDGIVLGWFFRQKRTALQENIFRELTSPVDRLLGAEEIDYELLKQISSTFRNKRDVPEKYTAARKYYSYLTEEILPRIYKDKAESIIERVRNIVGSQANDSLNHIETFINIETMFFILRGHVSLFDDPYPAPIGWYIHNSPLTVKWNNHLIGRKKWRGKDWRRRLEAINRHFVEKELDTGQTVENRGSGPNLFPYTPSAVMRLVETLSDDKKGPVSERALKNQFNSIVQIVFNPSNLKRISRSRVFRDTYEFIDIMNRILKKNGNYRTRFLKREFKNYLMQHYYGSFLLSLKNELISILENEDDVDGLKEVLIRIGNVPFMADEQLKNIFKDTIEDNLETIRRAILEEKNGIRAFQLENVIQKMRGDHHTSLYYPAEVDDSLLQENAAVLRKNYTYSVKELTDALDNALQSVNHLFPDNTELQENKTALDLLFFEEKDVRHLLYLEALINKLIETNIELNKRKSRILKTDLNYNALVEEIAIFDHYLKENFYKLLRIGYLIGNKRLLNEMSVHLFDFNYLMVKRISNENYLTGMNGGLKGKLNVFALRYLFNELNKIFQGQSGQVNLESLLTQLLSEKDVLTVKVPVRHDCTADKDGDMHERALHEEVSVKEYLNKHYEYLYHYFMGHSTDNNKALRNKIEELLGINLDPANLLSTLQYAVSLLSREQEKLGNSPEDEEEAHEKLKWALETILSYRKSDEHQEYHLEIDGIIIKYIGVISYIIFFADAEECRPAVTEYYFNKYLAGYEKDLGSRPEEKELYVKYCDAIKHLYRSIRTKEINPEDMLDRLQDMVDDRERYPNINMSLFYSSLGIKYYREIQEISEYLLDYLIRNNSANGADSGWIKRLYTLVNINLIFESKSDILEPVKIIGEIKVPEHHNALFNATIDNIKSAYQINILINPSEALNELARSINDYLIKLIDSAVNYDELTNNELSLMDDSILEIVGMIEIVRLDYGEDKAQEVIRSTFEKMKKLKPVVDKSPSYSFLSRYYKNYYPDVPEGEILEIWKENMWVRYYHKKAEDLQNIINTTDIADVQDLRSLIEALIKLYSYSLFFNKPVSIYTTEGEKDVLNSKELIEEYGSRYVEALKHFQIKVDEPENYLEGDVAAEIKKLEELISRGDFGDVEAANVKIIGNTDDVVARNAKIQIQKLLLMRKSRSEYLKDNLPGRVQNIISRMKLTAKDSNRDRYAKEIKDIEEYLYTNNFTIMAIIMQVLHKHKDIHMLRQIGDIVTANWEKSDEYSVLDKKLFVLLDEMVSELTETNSDTIDFVKLFQISKDIAELLPFEVNEGNIMLKMYLFYKYHTAFIGSIERIREQYIQFLRENPAYISEPDFYNVLYHLRGIGIFREWNKMESLVPVVFVISNLPELNSIYEELSDTQEIPEKRKKHVWRKKVNRFMRISGAEYENANLDRDKKRAKEYLDRLINISHELYLLLENAVKRNEANGLLLERFRRHYSDKMKYLKPLINRDYNQARIAYIADILYPENVPGSESRRTQLLIESISQSYGFSYIDKILGEIDRLLSEPSSGDHTEVISLLLKLERYLYGDVTGVEAVYEKHAGEYGRHVNTILEIIKSNDSNKEELIRSIKWFRSLWRAKLETILKYDRTSSLVPLLYEIVSFELHPEEMTDHIEFIRQYKSELAANGIEYEDDNDHAVLPPIDQMPLSDQDRALIDEYKNLHGKYKYRLNEENAHEFRDIFVKLAERYKSSNNPNAKYEIDLLVGKLYDEFVLAFYIYSREPKGPELLTLFRDSFLKPIEQKLRNDFRADAGISHLDRKINEALRMIKFKETETEKCRTLIQDIMTYCPVQEYFKEHKEIIEKYFFLEYYPQLIKLKDSILDVIAENNVNRVLLMRFYNLISGGGGFPYQPGPETAYHLPLPVEYRYKLNHARNLLSEYVESKSRNKTTEAVIDYLRAELVHLSKLTNSDSITEEERRKVALRSHSLQKIMKKAEMLMEKRHYDKLLKEFRKRGKALRRIAMAGRDLEFWILVKVILGDRNTGALDRELQNSLYSVNKKVISLLSDLKTELGRDPLDLDKIMELLDKYANYCNKYNLSSNDPITDPYRDMFEPHINAIRSKLDKIAKSDPKRYKNIEYSLVSIRNQFLFMNRYSGMVESASIKLYDSVSIKKFLRSANALMLEYEKTLLESWNQPELDDRQTAFLPDSFAANHIELIKGLFTMAELKEQGENPQIDRFLKTYKELIMMIAVMGYDSILADAIQKLYGLTDNETGQIRNKAFSLWEAQVQNKPLLTFTPLALRKAGEYLEKGTYRDDERPDLEYEAIFALIFKKRAGNRKNIKNKMLTAFFEKYKAQLREMLSLRFNQTNGNIDYYLMEVRGVLLFSEDPDTHNYFDEAIEYFSGFRWDKYKLIEYIEHQKDRYEEGNIKSLDEAKKAVFLTKAIHNYLNKILYSLGDEIPKDLFVFIELFSYRHPHFFNHVLLSKLVFHIEDQSQNYYQLKINNTLTAIDELLAHDTEDMAILREEIGDELKQLLKVLKVFYDLSREGCAFHRNILEQIKNALESRLPDLKRFLSLHEEPAPQYPYIHLLRILLQDPSFTYLLPISGENPADAAI